MSDILFIDANQYLLLYGLQGKKMLDLLDANKPYIFVTVQIVDEVTRNKLRCANEYFTNQYKELGSIKAPMSNHILGISDEKANEFAKAFEAASLKLKELS